MNNKDKFGEFFTPKILIDELIDQLPIQVWSNPELTWLDPCAGKGNFFVIIFDRLMKGLENLIPNSIERRKHIINKMLFIIEINQENENDLIKSFGTDANIYIQDFLNPVTFLNLKFDIILANPPYQTTKITSYTGSVGNKTLWDKFLYKCLSMNNINGFIGFITPANWRRPNHPLYQKITVENNLIYLHIYSKKNGLLYFDAQTRFDLYLLNNNNQKKRFPTIVDEKDIKHINFDLSIWPFLPNFAYENIKHFLVNEPKNEILYDSSFFDARKLSKGRDSKYRYPIIHTLTKKGIGLRYSKIRNYHFQSRKVILNVNEKQYPVNDFESKYGMSQLSFGIPIKSYLEGENIIKIINSPKFKELLSATKWSSFQTDYRMFKYLIF